MKFKALKAVAFPAFKIDVQAGDEFELTAEQAVHVQGFVGLVIEPIKKKRKKKNDG